ncbi:MAG TPA: hypothetical protein VMT10_15155 [Solirubrobacteraceae bacterium]|nr:hypothetical protein [Solirubrobacteraceae bacterium]
MPCSPRSPLAALGAVGLSLALAACGSAGSGATGTSGAGSRGQRDLMVADAGTTPAIAAHPAAPTSAAGCRTTTLSTLAAVARRIYFQAAHGRNGANAVVRLSRSRALADAVAAGSHRATIAALQPLLKHQILHITIRHGSAVVADVGHGRVMAPVHGRLYAGGRIAGTYVLSVMSPASYAGIASSVTGSSIVLRSGTHVVAAGGAAPARIPARGRAAVGGARYRVASFSGEAFPSGPLRIFVLAGPQAFAACDAVRPAGVTDVLGAVAVRLYNAEAHGAKVQDALRYVARDPAYVRALTSRDRAGLANAVDHGIFKVRRLHIVRVRGQGAGGFVDDIGGPYVLAPASIALRGPGGRDVGTITLAVQDDTGYIKLLTRFTGGAVILRQGRTVVPGSMFDPGPASIPARGTLTYRGRRYQAYSFTGTAFPSGPLRISLLVPVA